MEESTIITSSKLEQFTNTGDKYGYFIPNINSDVSKNALLMHCITHPSCYSNFIHLSNSNSHHMICQNCIKDRNLTQNSILSIKQLLDTNPSTSIFLGQSYPVLSDPFLQESIEGMVTAMDSIKQSISQFYQEFWETIQAAIQRAHKTQQKKILELQELYKQTIEAVRYIGQVQELQKIVIESSNESKNGNNNQTKKLDDFIQKHCQESVQNTALLKELYRKFQNIQRQFALAQPQLILDLAKELCEKIDFFSDENNPSCTLVDQVNIQQINQIRLQESAEILSPINLEGNLSLESSLSQPVQQHSQLKQPAVQGIPADFESHLEQLEVIPCDESIKRVKIKRNPENFNLAIMNNTSSFSFQNIYKDIQFYLNKEIIQNQQYIIRVQLFHNKTSKAPEFSLGFMNLNQIPSSCIVYQDYVYNESNGGNITKILKGNKLHSDKDNHKIRKEGKYLEFRVHLAENYIRVGTYPDYANVSELQEKTKRFQRNDEEQYYFTMLIGNRSDEIKVLEFMKVNSFDERM